MPTRATARGAQRTPLARDCDVLICGASFAGLTLARELEGTGARVLMVDRYEIGERQTSACAAPTDWLVRLGLGDSILQTFPDIVVHVPGARVRWPLPFSFSTFDYRQLCRILREGSPATDFETATVAGVERGATHVVRTDRGELRAPLVVDAMGWRRLLGAGAPVQPPEARLSRGLEVHPRGEGGELEIWIDRRYVRAGYSWSFPAGDELRIGAGSFEPRDRVREPTVALAGDLGLEAVGYQGNWIPHQLRPATGDGIFFVGDSAGHCLPLTAEGIRPAFYFALALGRELRAVLGGDTTRAQALASYAAFSASHRRAFTAMLAAQHLVGRITDSAALGATVRLVGRRGLGHWIFGHYRDIAPPSFAGVYGRRTDGASGGRAAAVAMHG